MYQRIFNAIIDDKLKIYKYYKAQKNEELKEIEKKR